MGYPAIFTPLFILTFILSAALTGGFCWLAKKARLLPAVRERDVHKIRKPRLGGLAMWLTVVLVLTFIPAGQFAYLLDFGNNLVGGLDLAQWGIFAGLLVLLVFGLVDDIAGLKPWQQLVGQFLAVLALIIAGIGVTYIRLPFGVQLPLDQIPLQLPVWLGGSTIYLWSVLFTLVWVMTMINVMNFFDGLDGLAGSVAMTAAVVLVFVSLRLGFLATATLSVVVFGAAAGFLPWNWYPSRIFMGTVGSQLLGFMLGVIAIISGGKVATAVLVLGIPLFDAVVVVIRRLLAGQSPFKADQRHLHHRLMKIGLSVPMVVLLINVVAVIFGILALRTQEANQKGIFTLALAGLMVLFILLTYFLEKKKRVAG